MATRFQRCLIEGKSRNWKQVQRESSLVDEVLVSPLSEPFGDIELVLSPGQLERFKMAGLGLDKWPTRGILLS